MTVDEFKAILANGHIYRSLYHFTAGANLPSIAKHGIASKEHAAKTGITISVHGGNEWSRDADTLKGLNGYSIYASLKAIRCATWRPWKVVSRTPSIFQLIQMYFLSTELR